DQCDGGTGNNTFLMCENVPDSVCAAATYEAEAMTASAGGSTTGGWNLWSNGYIKTYHDFTAGPGTLWVTAKGEQGGGIWPHMRVLVDGVLVDDFFVDSPNWDTYPVP